MSEFQTERRSERIVGHSASWITVMNNNGNMRTKKLRVSRWTRVALSITWPKPPCMFADRFSHDNRSLRSRGVSWRWSRYRVEDPHEICRFKGFNFAFIHMISLNSKLQKTFFKTFKEILLYLRPRWASVILVKMDKKKFGA